MANSSFSIYFISFLEIGLLLGVNFTILLVISFLFFKQRKHFYKIISLFALTCLFYLINESMVLTCYVLKLYEIGKQFHRLQALTIAFLITFIPLLVAEFSELKFPWNKINWFFYVFLLIFFIINGICAFTLPNLFISLENQLTKDAILTSRWAEARGTPGILYFLRDFFAALFLIYMLLIFVIELIRNFKKKSYLFLAILGILFMISVIFFDLLLIYIPLPKDNIFKDLPSFTGLGLNIFLIFLIISIVKKYSEEEKELEKFRKYQSLSFWAGSIAHDFKNLLTAISVNVSLAQEALTNTQDAEKFLADAQKACERSRILADQLLLFAKGGEPKKELIDLQKILSSLSSCIPQTSNIDLRIEIETPLNYVIADSSQINQVFENIIFNSVQAMPKGGEIKIEAKNIENLAVHQQIVKKQAYVEISFKDSGPGFSKEDIESIFKSNFSTKGGKHGLGLTIAKTIVEKHDGFIQLETQEGQGACFKIYLPAQKAG